MTTTATQLAAALEEGWACDTSPDEMTAAAAELRRLDAVERERDNLRARIDRAVKAAEEHFGEDAIRYKLSLNKQGRPTNTFPQHMNGNWYALQRADNDAHVGLALRCKEAEAEVEALRKYKAAAMLMVEDAARYRWLRDMDMLDQPSVDMANVFKKYTGSALDAAIDAAIDAAMKGAAHG